jgi:Na+/H+-dicarboxylate symporter
VKTISLLVLAALVAGIGVGEVARSSGDATLNTLAGVIEPFGGLWLNALRMTVVPLIVALLVTGIGSVADAARTGGLVLRAVVLFSVLILFAAGYSVLASQGLLSLFPVDADAAAGLIAGAGGGALQISEAPGFASWLQALAPSNPVRAAADDAILPLVTFAVFFGFATTRLPAEARGRIVGFFDAVAQAMVIIVRWILLAGPVGVFALALGVGLRAGAGAAGALVHYVVLVTAITAGATVIGWLLAIVAGRQPMGRFTAAAAPVWAIAASTQSSLASLPAMIESALERLHLPAAVVDVALPLSVAVFRFTSPVANLAVCFFVAHVYGLSPTPLQIVSAVVVAYAVSIAAVGLPGQVSFMASIAPICLALGAPIDLPGILIAVEVIPDIFRTLGNVTADLAATSILSRKTGVSPAL